MIGRCQICGRKKPTRKDGTIGHHFTKGERCRGAGAVPLELGDDRLEAVILEARDRQERAMLELRALRDRRANWIDPAIERAAYAFPIKLERRLRRHRDWPARARRQMERYGYAEQPPAYLIERERNA